MWYVYILQVPSSYLWLQKVLEGEVAQRRESGVPPVLTQEEFTRLTDKIPENDILDDEDLALGAYECVICTYLWGAVCQKNQQKCDPSYVYHVIYV